MNRCDDSIEKLAHLIHHEDLRDPERPKNSGENVNAVSMKQVDYLNS
jgi:hypothetical protein